MFRKTLYIFLLVIGGLDALSQTGGDNVYEFLNLTHSSFVASLGGTNVSVRTSDLNLAFHNPALLEEGMDRSLVLDYTRYFAGINFGMTMYSRSFSSVGNFAAGLTYLNYGTFTEADESGNITGTFKAAEYALSLIYSRTIDTLFSVGVNLKPVLSHLEKYTSFGIALDAGAAWHSRNNLTSAGITVRNLGFQVTTYTGEEREKLPFEIQAGISHRLEHAPFRFSLTLRHLEKYDLTHTYSPSGLSPSVAQEDKPEFAENLLRHIVFGTEVIPHKSFYVSLGYNHQRRKELQVESRASTVGFSWGFGIKTSYLALGFGHARFHLAGASNHISLILRPDLLYKKIAG